MNDGLGVRTQLSVKSLVICHFIYCFFYQLIELSIWPFFSCQLTHPGPGPFAVSSMNVCVIKLKDLSLFLHFLSAWDSEYASALYFPHFLELSEQNGLYKNNRSTHFVLLNLLTECNSACVCVCVCVCVVVIVIVIVIGFFLSFCFFSFLLFLSSFALLVMT